MKRKMTNSIALGLTVLLAVMTFVLTAQGQQQKKKPVAATGVFTPGMGQILRISVTGSVPITINFGWKEYMVEGCSSGVCRHSVASEGTSGPVTLDPNEAASLDIQGTGKGIEAMVFSNNTNLRVLAQIIDAQTGNVITSEDISQPG